MSLVLDCSIAIAWSIEDEASPAIDSLLNVVLAGGAVVPALWHWEVGNVLLIANRRGRLPIARMQISIDQLRQLPIETDGDALAAAWEATTVIARQHSLSVYDAAYLELAMRRGLPLATLDKALRRAAVDEGVNVLPAT